MQTIPLLPPEGDRRTWIRLADGSVVKRAEKGIFHIPIHLSPGLLGKGWRECFDKLSGPTDLAKSAPTVADRIGALLDTTVTLGQRERLEVTRAISKMHDALAEGDIPAFNKALGQAQAVADELRKEEAQLSSLKKCLATPRRLT